jgi:hypothetical protein
MGSRSSATHGCEGPVVHTEKHVCVHFVHGEPLWAVCYSDKVQGKLCWNDRGSRAEGKDGRTWRTERVVG